MCASSEVWQKHLLDAIRYLVELGADGVYLDQLAMRRRASAMTAGMGMGCMTGRRGTESCLRRPESCKRRPAGR